MKDLADPEAIVAESFPTHQEIEKRAYEIYLKSDEDGHDLDHWLAAEEELLGEYARRKTVILQHKTFAAGQ